MPYKKPQAPFRVGNLIVSFDNDDEIAKAFRAVAKKDRRYRGHRGAIKSVLTGLMIEYITKEGDRVLKEEKKLKKAIEDASRDS